MGQSHYTMSFLLSDLAVQQPNQTTSSTPDLHQVFNFKDNMALASSDENLLSTLPFTMKDFEPNLSFGEKHIHNKNLQINSHV
jgi:hypothetical protein